MKSIKFRKFEGHPNFEICNNLSIYSNMLPRVNILSENWFDRVNKHVVWILTKSSNDTYYATFLSKLKQNILFLLPVLKE